MKASTKMYLVLIAAVICMLSIAGMYYFDYKISIWCDVVLWITASSVIISILVSTVIRIFKNYNTKY